MLNSISIVLGLGLSLIVLNKSCADSKFRGKDKAKASSSEDLAQEESAVTSVLPVENQNTCIEGDKIKLNLPPDIQDCMNKGRIFNFKTNLCLEVATASYSCDFAGLAAKIEEKGMSSKSVSAARDKNAYLVACGEKNAGKTLVAQWYHLPDDIDPCLASFSPAQVVTSCYKLYAEGELPANATKEDQERIVQSCLAE